MFLYVPDPNKTKAALLDPSRDYGHRFLDVVRFLQATGWALHMKGSHHIFRRPEVPVLLNLQPERDGKTKAYQIRQLRRALIKFNL
jgi:predicted RNA binding protein YcfA (HicA-like mRNA interferase family)